MIVIDPTLSIGAGILVTSSLAATMIARPYSVKRWICEVGLVARYTAGDRV
jgi:hypothetical protein